MFYNNQPPMGPYMPWWPQPPTPTPPVDPFQQINQTISWLEGMKKYYKEDKKPDDDKKRKTPASEVVAMVLFMTIMSPIVGPIVYHFFGLTRVMMPAVRQLQ